jgi:ATP-dependent protease Clp ATPase subunit
VKAFEEKTGARGLVSAVEKVLLKFEKRLPSTQIQRFVVTRDVVENPERELERLLADPSNPEMQAKLESLLSREKVALKESIMKREGEFRKRYGIVLLESRIALIANRMIEKGYDVNTVIEEVVDIQRVVEDFEKDFYRKHGISLRFSNEAVDRVTEIALEEDGKGIGICSRLSKDYEHGFKLIRDRIGQREFILTREAIDNPETYLNQVIREIFSQQADYRVEDQE